LKRNGARAIVAAVVDVQTVIKAGRIITAAVKPVVIMKVNSQYCFSWHEEACFKSVLYGIPVIR